MNPETFPKSITGKFPGKSPEKKKQTNEKKNSNNNVRLHATRELQNIVLAWMKDSTGPRRNRSVFSRKAEVANSTIQRLMNDDVFPSTDNLIKMLHVLFASDDLAAIKTKLEQHHTNLYTYIKDIPVFAKIPTKSSYSASTPESAEDKQLKIDVVRELREMISEFMRNNLDYSTIPAFARKANVPETTVRSTLKPSANSIPDQDNLMRILVALTGFQNTRDVVEYLDNRRSAILTHLRRHTVYGSFTASQGTGFVMEGVTAPKIPMDDDVYLAHSLIDQDNGTRLKDLLQLMGASASAAVEKLMKEGLAVLSDDGILRRGISSPIITKNTALNMAKVLMKRFTRGESDDSRVTFFSERVSAEGLLDLHRATDEYIKVVTNIVDHKKGSIPIFLFGVLDKMELKSVSSTSLGDDKKS